MIDQLMNAIPTRQLAEMVGEDEATTRQAVEAALPALLGGLSANAERADGARSLLDALGQHQDGLADDVRVDSIDTGDGEKIVGHVFGSNTDAVVNQLGGLGGGQSSALVRKLLPLLAPIVLSWLAKQVGGALGGQGGTSAGRAPGGQGLPDSALPGQTTPTRSATPAAGGDGTSILQDVLGSVLGSATGRQPGSAGGGGLLGGVLDNLLGGGR